MSNLLTTAFEIVSIARRHGIVIDQTAAPASAGALVLEELKERSRLARGDIKTLEGLVYYLAPREPHHRNGLPHSGDNPAIQEE